MKREHAGALDASVPDDRDREPHSQSLPPGFIIVGGAHRGLFYKLSTPAVRLPVQPQINQVFEA